MLSSSRLLFLTSASPTDSSFCVQCKRPLCKTSDPSVNLPQQRHEMDGFCLGPAKSWLPLRTSQLHRTALPATGLTSIMCKIKQPQCNSQHVRITETPAGNQGCPTSVYTEINIEAAEIPAGDRNPDAMTHKDPWKFSVSWNCSHYSLNFLWAVLWGRMWVPSYQQHNLNYSVQALGGSLPRFRHPDHSRGVLVPIFLSFLLNTLYPWVLPPRFCLF